MSLTKSHLIWLSKLAKTGRAYIGFALPPEQVPEWARMEFRVQRELIRLARLGERIEAARAVKKAARRASRETILSVLAEMPAKPKRLNGKSYQKGASKGWETRKRLAANREASAASEPKDAAA